MIKEITYGIYSENEIDSLVNDGKAFVLKAERPVLVGAGVSLLKVNTNIGVSDANSYDNEIQKLKKLCSLEYRPDTMMDHTIVPLGKPLWKTMVEEFDGAVGTLPHYLPYDENNGISEEFFFDNLSDMANNGVSFVTLHPTADINLYRLAQKKKRLVPTTSRGGYVLLKDQVINHRKENIVAHNFVKIMEILKAHDMAVSIGSVFRPATIHEALDDIHREETILQKKFIDIAKQIGVKVQLEGIGHISIDKMNTYADLIRDYGVPLMPLGPMVSDEIIGFDHITNAIGASMMANTGVVGIINCVTREEHTGHVPSFDSIIEGLKTSRVVAHAYNVGLFPQYKNATEKMGLERSKINSCVMSGGIFSYKSEEQEKRNCSRCCRECPLKPINMEEI